MLQIFFLNYKIRIINKSWCSTSPDKSETSIFFLTFSVCLSVRICVYLSLSFLMLFTTLASSQNTATNIYTSDQHDEWCEFDGAIMDGRAMMAYGQPFITLRGLSGSSEYQHEQLWKGAELLHILRQMTIWIYTGFMRVASTGFGEQCVGVWGGMCRVCAQVVGIYACRHLYTSGFPWRC